MNLAYKKILGKFTKVLGFGKTPPPHVGKISQIMSFFFWERTLLLLLWKCLAVYLTAVCSSTELPVCISLPQNCPFQFVWKLSMHVVVDDHYHHDHNDYCEKDAAATRWRWRRDCERSTCAIWRSLSANKTQLLLFPNIPSSYLQKIVNKITTHYY